MSFSTCSSSAVSCDGHGKEGCRAAMIESYCVVNRTTATATDRPTAEAVAVVDRRPSL